MNERQAGRLAMVVAGALALGLAGCSGGGSGTQQQSQGGIFGLFAPKKDPNADLTPAEGRKLVGEIRKDRKRMQTLTPGERRFSAKTAAAEKERRQD